LSHEIFLFYFFLFFDLKVVKLIILSGAQILIWLTIIKKPHIILWSQINLKLFDFVAEFFEFRQFDNLSRCGCQNNWG